MDTEMSQANEAVGIDVGDPMPAIEQQDERPKRQEVHSGVAITSLFVRESGQQGRAIRGPIELHELVDEDSETMPVVYYRRTTREERKALQDTVAEIYAEEEARAREEKELPRSVNEDVNLAIFLNRALTPDGKRMFSAGQLGEAQDGEWNHECIARVVGEMATGSRTRLSDADLGNS